MLDTLDLLFKNLKDPLLVLLFLVMIGMFFTMKMLVKLLKSRDEYIRELHTCIAVGLGDSNKTLGKVVTLIEGMVYGRLKT